jgi:hypothetical protein
VLQNCCAHAPVEAIEFRFKFLQVEFLVGELLLPDGALNLGLEDMSPGREVTVTGVIGGRGIEHERLGGIGVCSSDRQVAKPVAFG